MKDFLGIERGLPEASDEQHIFNKAIFDATSEAIRQLLPPYRTRLKAAQGRLKRHSFGSPEWKEILVEEARRQVVKWTCFNESPVDEDEAVRLMLLRDIEEVR